jgi:hypothetical protein
MIPTFKNGWTLMKINKKDPLGYKGFLFVLYDKDDITIIAERRAKTASRIWYEIVKLSRKYPL